MIVTARCGAPVKRYDLSRAPDALDSPGARDNPVPSCWRPKGHGQKRHMSEASYKRMLARNRARKRARRRRRMSVPGDRLRT